MNISNLKKLSKFTILIHHRGLTGNVIFKGT
jgi:hypothetical protein